MRFVNPLFLVGILATLLPVLIHLLTRDRIRKVEFSTLRFFAKSSQRVLRRKKYQEMFLLALRMVICGLLAVAFARPFFGGKREEAHGASVRTARVIVADVSGSMGRGPLCGKVEGGVPAGNWGIVGGKRCGGVGDVCRYAERRGGI